MFTNRLINVLIAVVLAVVVFLTVQNVRDTTALAQKTYSSYDLIEQVRAERSNGSLQADRSYDAIEHQRVEASLAGADRSYDEVEALRTERAIVADRSYDEIEDLRVMRTRQH